MQHYVRVKTQTGLLLYGSMQLKNRRKTATQKCSGRSIRPSHAGACSIRPQLMVEGHHTQHMFQK